GIVNELQFDVALHIGTLGALVAVFWHDWVTLARAGLGSLRDRSLADREARLAWLIVLATIPGALAGALFQRPIEQLLRSPVIVGLSMAIVGLALGVVDRLGTRRRDEYALGPWGALAIGIGQAFALVPGVSRSGSTIGVGLMEGLTRAGAARFSFLLSTPIIFGAVAKESVDVARRGIAPEDAVTYAVGILASAIVGYASIRFLLGYLRRHSLLPFVAYRIVAGAVVTALSLAGRL